MNQNSNEPRDLALRELIASFERHLTQNTSPFLSQEQFEDLLDHYYEQGDYDQTLTVANLAIEQHQFTPEFYKWKALIHKINLEEDASLDAIERLSIYAPNDSEGLMLRLEIYIHFNKLEEAKELLTSLFGRFQSKRKQSLLFFFHGLIDLEEDRPDSALEAFRSSIELDPYQEPALDELLNASELLHLRGGLGKFFDGLLEEDPFNHLLWYYLGLYHDDNGDDYRALDALANARSLKDRVGRYELDYADKLFDLERYEQALRAYDTYWDLPTAEASYETFMRMGRSHQMLDDLAAARRCYFKAAEADPGHYDTYQYLGECFAAEGKWGQAAHNYGRAVELPAHTAECWLGLGLCLSAQNQSDEAERAFRRAVEAGEGRYSDATVSLGIFLADTGRETEALELMETALQTYEDAALMYGMVAISLICNRRVQALEMLNEALAGFLEERSILLEWYPSLREDRDVDAIFRLYGV